MSVPRSVVIHGHFYQPPREDPWLDEAEIEPSAAPFHDWNERIEQECYRVVAAARLMGPGGRIASIENLYAWISFNFGPTLLEWLEHAAPDSYAALLAADRQSAQRLGHGNALAMPYHHAILPLSTRREKTLEVHWGIADFRRRFGRDPVGMWLPETAVDEETLDVLAAEGIRFTVLAPSQVVTPPPQGLPGLVRTSAQRSIAVFVYDGGISHDVAFGALVRDAAAWADRLVALDAEGHPRALVSVATDGETYGHHHPFGEMALAATVHRLRLAEGVTVDNFSAFLARHGATHEVTLVSPSAWSCAHGVERWRSDCGCRIAPDQATQQRWRTPLREAISWLTGECHRLYDRDAPGLIRDPGGALVNFGGVIGAGPEAVRDYGRRVASLGTAEEQVIRATELLEMVRGAERTLTSCAWFFDDIGGIESLQVLRYAAWAIGLAGPDRGYLEEGFTRRLAPAESNFPALGTGRDLYLHRGRPVLPPPVRIGAGLAAARALAPEAATSAAWVLDGPDGSATLTNRRTGRSYALRFELEVQASFEVLVTVRSPLLEAPMALGLIDLPERQRTAIAGALRRQVLKRLLSADERGQLLAGVGLRAVVRQALTRRAHRLEREGGADAVMEVAQLLDILEELGQAAPFEAQTSLYRAWVARGAGLPSLTSLVERVGVLTQSSDPATPPPPR
jgi:hypothetical protein